MTPDPKCCMHGGCDRQAGNNVVWRVERVASPIPLSIEVKLNLTWLKLNLVANDSNNFLFVFYLCRSWRVASMTRRASWANCFASVVGWKILTWLKEGVFGWTRTSFWIRFSSNRMMSSIRSDARLPSSSSWLTVIELISTAARLAIDFESEKKKLLHFLICHERHDWSKRRSIPCTKDWRSPRPTNSFWFDSNVICRLWRYFELAVWKMNPNTKLVIRLKRTISANVRLDG